MRRILSKSSSPYRYRDLPEGNWIRLLVLLPGQSWEPIRCELATVPIDHAPKYEAISYVWGDPTVTTAIRCCGGVVKVTRNLYQVLCRVRSTESVRMLWADAVCINQGNLNERAHQVGLIRLVFENAERVLVWLGPDVNGHAEKAFRALRSMSEYYEEMEKTLSNFWEQPLPDSGHWIQTLEQNSLTALHGLYANPWFKRVWVQQEIAVATTALVLYGEHSIPWSLVVYYAVLRRLRPELSHINAAVLGVNQAFTDVWATYGNQKSWTTEVPLLKKLAISAKGCMAASGENLKEAACARFLKIVSFASRLQASDRRDMIYAFLGHPAARICFGEGNRSLITVDYTTTVTALFQDVVNKSVTQMGSLYALSKVVHSDATLGSTNPSWVPPFDTNLSVVQIAHHPWAPGFYNAGKRPQNDNFPLSGSLCEIRNGRLKAYGCVLDHVFDNSAAIRGADLFFVAGDNSNETNVVHQIWSTTAQKMWIADSPYENTVEAFQLTLAMGRLAMRSSSPAEDDLELNRQMFNLFAKKYCGCAELVTPRASLSKARFDKVHLEGSYVRWLADKCHKRKFFVTSKGYFGLGPRVLQPDDLCCVLIGSSVPFILRKDVDRGGYKLLGECYVHGIMRGEAIDMLNARLLSLKEFELF